MYEAYMPRIDIDRTALYAVLLPEYSNPSSVWKVATAVIAGTRTCRLGLICAKLLE
jgi:hypothetical protein